MPPIGVTPPATHAHFGKILNPATEPKEYKKYATDFRLQPDAFISVSDTPEEMKQDWDLFVENINEYKYLQHIAFVTTKTYQDSYPDKTKLKDVIPSVDDHTNFVNVKINANGDRCVIRHSW